MSNTASRHPTIDPNEIVARRDDDDLFILDVRNAEDYEEWHIDESHNLPIYDQLLDKNFIGLEASLDDIPRDKEIAIVCVAGVTSAYAASFLRDRGYDAKSVANGMNGWGRVHVAYEIDGLDGIMQIVRPGTGCLSYLAYDGTEGVVVDPSLYTDEYVRLAADHEVDIVGAIDTHAHADHISGAPLLADELDIPYYLHPADSGELNTYTAIEDGDTIPVGSREFRVEHTPGHTPGSVSLGFGRAVLSGDTLFIRSVGRPDLEEGSETAIRDAARNLFDSLDVIASLPDETRILPGHFSDEALRPLVTTIGELEDENALFRMENAEEFIQTIVASLSDKPANYNQIKAINWGEEPLTGDAPDLELGPNNCAAN